MNVAPSQISPSQNFDLFYFLRNPTDSTTYYVRATIYDVRTGDILTTVDLVPSPNNTRLFSKTIQAPADPTGYGRNILAISKLYTDAGFTTESTDYEEQEQYYLVKAGATVLGGGGFDYQTLREIVTEELGKGISRIPPPTEMPEMPFDTLFGAIGALQREINRVPKNAFDSAPLQTALEAITQQISELPQPDKLDLSPVNDGLGTLTQKMADMSRDTKLAGHVVMADHQEQMKRIADELILRFDASIKALLANAVSQPKPKQPQPEPSPVDIRHLMSV